MVVEIVDISRKVSFNYFVKETYEGGIVLFGWEIKSIRLKGINIVGSYLKFEKAECWLYESFISMKKIAFFSDFSENRKRKILLKKKEIDHISGLLKIKNYALLPSKFYWKNNFIKLEICLCLGKKKYDKKRYIKNDFLNVKNYDLF